MNFCAQADDVFIAEVSMGYSYLVSNSDYIRSIADGDSALIIGLGVNDMGNLNNYITYINKLAAELPCDVYYMSVNPVDEEAEEKTSYHTKNETINNFNNSMRLNLVNVTYIDCNNFIYDVGFDTRDGVHFTKETYQNMYNFIKDFVKASRAAQFY